MGLLRVCRADFVRDSIHSLMKLLVAAALVNALVAKGATSYCPARFFALLFQDEALD